eukprot:TRINITY_DN8095_c0_g1::TRINITY_DN8095_c0_g1_i1::g.20171::m.20171 TRINITY_DN8095_c0_g1::TRINITY_DN8095_c0_g1_i1::g.20171  ORF type:complete len:354 (-),score=121.87 TRINITY_DN8095_c0_g1_i1:33-1094(-)
MITIEQNDQLRKFQLSLYVQSMKYEDERESQFKVMVVQNITQQAQECTASTDNGMFMIRVGTRDGLCLKTRYSLSEGPGEGIEVGECEYDENGEVAKNSVWFLRSSDGAKWLIHPSDDWSRCLIMFSRSPAPGLYPCQWGYRKWRDVENDQGRWLIRYDRTRDAFTVQNRHHLKCLQDNIMEVTTCQNSTAKYYVTPVPKPKLRLGIAPPPPKIKFDVYRPRNLTHLALASGEDITPEEQKAMEFTKEKIDEVNETLWEEQKKVTEELIANMTEAEIEKARWEGTSLSLPFKYEKEVAKPDDLVVEAEAEGELWANMVCNERNYGKSWWSRLDSWLYTCDGQNWVPDEEYLIG